MALLEGRTAVVTGAGRGLGRSYALALAREGARVVVNDPGVALDGTSHDQGPADRVVAEIEAAGGEAVASYDSVASWEGAERIVEAAVTTFGTIDVLVNNAGILRDRMGFNMTEEEWSSVLAVHLDGTFFCSRFAARAMRQQRRGRIINVSSPGLQGLAGTSNYQVAKAGIASLTWTWALELAKYGITVNALMPVAQTRIADTYTPPGDSGGHPDDVSPDKVAPLVVYLASDDAQWISGQLIGLGRGKLSLWARPTEVRTAFRDGGWTVEAIREHLRATVGSTLEPVGLRATTYDWYDGVGREPQQ